VHPVGFIIRRECVLQSSKLKPLKFIRGIPSLAQPQFSTLPWMLSLPSRTDQEYLSQDTYHELLVQSFLYRTHKTIVNTPSDLQGATCRFICMKHICYLNNMEEQFPFVF